jgi:hypothetical protein
MNKGTNGWFQVRLELNYCYSTEKWYSTRHEMTSIQGMYLLFQFDTNAS